MRDYSQIFRFVATPKFILSVLALLNLLAVPHRFAGLCFYNWRDAFYLAFTLLVAAVALLPATWWSCLGALIFSGTIIYDFIYVLVKVFGFVAAHPDDPDLSLTPEVWLKAMRGHPEEWLQVALAAAIFVSAAIYFGRDVFRQPRPMA